MFTCGFEHNHEKTTIGAARSKRVQVVGSGTKALEHNAGVGGVAKHGPALQHLGLIVDGPENELEFGRVANALAQTKLGQHLENALEQIVGLRGRDGGGAKVGVGDARQVEEADELVGEEFDETRVMRLTQLAHDLHALIVGLELALAVPRRRVLAPAAVVAVECVVVDGRARVQLACDSLVVVVD